jgi:rSAM/selenodomain-associated transferase 1
MAVRLIVLAKAPVPGRSKTRLCPPLTFELAAGVAEAALIDTLAAVASLPGPRPVLALEGSPGHWLPPRFDVVRQRGSDLAERIGAAFAEVGGPALLIGMDTPQVTPGLLLRACQTLESPGIDAVLGPAEDGGWWALGLRRPEPRAFSGVPMSTPRTGHAQRARLQALGLRCAGLPTLRDVDTIEDAVAVAGRCPGSAFAAAVAAALGDAREPAMAR